jgi:AcrR family transcriptional regulator
MEAPRLPPEVGVSRVLIYRHFDSKEQLYREILDQTRELLAEATGAPDGAGTVKPEGTCSGGARTPM